LSSHNRDIAPLAKIGVRGTVARLSMSKITSKKILVAEDEEDVRRLVCNSLKNAGFATLEADDGPGALNAARTQLPALVVLDLMLPGMSGLEICKSLKNGAETKSIPILMLTAKAEEVDRIVGFELGADDYMTKPFSPRELVLRVQSILRRASGQPQEDAIVKLGEITLDRTQHKVAVKGKALELTATEFKLLATLMERRGRVQSRDVLLNDVWSYESMIDTRTVDTHVRRLREKLGKAGSHVETVRGFGYRMANIA
jgi:two-component system phosphate regulon response regulator PhoB